MMQSGLDISLLCQLQQRPAPYEAGEPRFWTDPHIATQMLLAHLDPNVDAASRRPEVIRRTTAWIASAFGLKPGERVLDLGCGPGLYANLLAEQGFCVTGVDFSEHSLEYARGQALRGGLAVEYRFQNYLDLEVEPGTYAAALLIYGDFCPLSPSQRARLLANIHRALVPGGWFIFDVSTPVHHHGQAEKIGWYASQAGFWRPGPHLVLEQGFAYPGDLFLDQYIVVEPDERVSVYRNWFQDYTPESLRAELEQNGFAVSGFWSDLTGTPYAESSAWIGTAAQKKDFI